MTDRERKGVRLDVVGAVMVAMRISVLLARPHAADEGDDRVLEERIARVVGLPGRLPSLPVEAVLPHLLDRLHGELKVFAVGLEFIGEFSGMGVMQTMAERNGRLRVHYLATHPASDQDVDASHAI